MSYLQLPHLETTESFVFVLQQTFLCEHFVTRYVFFYGEELLVPRNCLFNIFAATLHTGGRSGEGQVAGICEGGNEPSGFIKCGEFLD